MLISLLQYLFLREYVFIIRKSNQSGRVVPPRATSCKVSGTQAQTLKDTKSSFADYTLFFNGGFLSNYRTSYQKVDFTKCASKRAFHTYMEVQIYDCFIFGSRDAGFDIAWLMWSPFCRRVSFLSYRVSFGTLWKKDTQKTLVPAKSTCVNCELKLWLNEGRYLAKICTTMIVRPVSRGNKRYLRLLYVNKILVRMNRPPKIIAWS